MKISREGLLTILRKNSDHRKEYEYLIGKVNSLKDGRSIDIKELDELFNEAQLSASERNIILNNIKIKEQYTESPTFSHLTPSKYDLLHQDIPHPIYPIATTNNGDILCVQFTSTKHNFNKLIPGFKLEEEIPPEFIEQLKQVKTKKHLLNKLFNKDKGYYERTNETWVHGEKGDDALVYLGKTLGGRNQYYVPTLILLPGEDYEGIKVINKTAKPNQEYIVKARDLLLDSDSIKVVDLATKKFKQLPRSEIIPTELPSSWKSSELSDFEDQKDYTNSAKNLSPTRDVQTKVIMDSKISSPIKEFRPVKDFKESSSFVKDPPIIKDISDPLKE